LLETERNQGIRRYLSELSPSAESNYSLDGKPPRGLNARGRNSRPSESRRWARRDEEKAEVSATRIFKVFEPHPREIIIDEEKKLLINIINISAQMVAPATSLSPRQ